MAAAPVRRLLAARIRSRRDRSLKSGANEPERPAEQAPQITTRLRVVAGAASSRRKR